MATVLKKGGAEEPLVSSPSSGSITRAKMLLDVSVDEINDEFKRGYITARQRNDIMREKAHAVVDEMISEKGFFGAVLEQSIGNIQKGWDQILESANDPNKSESVMSRIKAEGLALWGSVQVLTGVLSAMGTVSGQQAERGALRAGASPGLARLINISVDVGSGFFPVGKTTQLGVKGIQKIQKIGAKEVETAAKIAETEKTAKIAEEAVQQSLAVEGIGEATGTVVKKPLSPSEQFVSDFRKFQREMASITEPQSHEQTARLAAQLELNLDDLRNVVPGRALDEKEMFAYLKALEPQVDELMRLANVLKKGGTEADANAFASHISEFWTLAPIFRGAEVTAGRAVEILKETPPMKKITDMLLGWDPESIARGDFQRAIRTIADDVLAASKKELTVAGVQSQSLWAQFKEGMWPKIREAYYNLLLPMSLPANVLGNIFATAQSVAERTTGGLFSADKAKGLVWNEGMIQAKGYATAFGDGAKAFGRAYKGIETGEASKLDYIPHQIPGVVGQMINVPADTLRGTDNFFRALLRRGSYYSEALRDGVHAGMSDSKSTIATAAYREKFGNESLSEFVARKVKFPTESMVNSADELATHHTYQDQLGAIASKLRGMAQVGPMSLWFAFMKSPINLAKYAWDRTPGLQMISGQLYRDIAAGGVKADEAIGRITLANMQGMFIYQLAQEGYITGSGPVDPTLRRVWMATHQPYSVQTEKGWMPITNFEPGNTPIGLMADFAQIHNQLDDPSAEQMGMAASFSIMRGMLDKTWWRTVSDLVDVATSIKEGTSPSAQLRDVILSPAMTVATGGPLVGAIRRGIDPIQRETRTLMDSFMSRIPGYSKNVPPVRDAYGEPVLPPQNIAGPWLGLVAPLKEKVIDKEDRVRKEGDALEIKVPQFPWTIGGSTRDDFDIRAPFPEDMMGVELTPKQRDRAQELFREFLRHPQMGMEKSLLDSPDYQSLTRAGKREMFMDQMAVYRQMAINTLSAEDPKIGAKLIESQSLKLMPLLQRNEQDELKQETTRSMDLFYKMAPEMRENLLRWGQPPGEDN